MKQELWTLRLAQEQIQCVCAAGMGLKVMLHCP